MAAKSAQDKQQAENDAEMQPPKAAEEHSKTAQSISEDGPKEVFEECDVDATVEELRKSDSLDAFGSHDGSPDRSKVRRFMEAVSRGTRRRIG